MNDMDLSNGPSGVQASNIHLFYEDKVCERSLLMKWSNEVHRNALSLQRLNRGAMCGRVSTIGAFGSLVFDTDVRACARVCHW